MISVGIDIGGTSIKAAVLDGDREVWSAASPAYSRPSAAEVVGALHAMLAGSPLASVACATVGLCVPGVLDEAGVAIVKSANMPGLIGLALPKAVREAMPSGLTISNGVSTFSDAHAAASDYARTRSLSGRLLAISLGTGIGAAVLDDGQLVAVTGRSSGHFGQMDVTVPGIEPVPVGPDGGRGGLEGYIGLPALAARHGDVSLWLASLRGVETELAALARAIRIAHAIYRPRHVALLGGIGIRLRPVLGSLNELVRDGLTGLAREDWEVSCGDSDDHAARGAARLAAQSSTPSPIK